MRRAFRGRLSGFPLMSLALAMMASYAIQSHAGSQFTAGHGDIGVGFDGVGLELHWHLGHESSAIVDGVQVDDIEYEPGEITAVVPNTSTFTRGLNDTEWDFIGNAAGDLTYYLPETSTAGVPFLGLASEELVLDDWSTALTWTLNSVTGSGVDNGGVFSMFRNLSTPSIFASTRPLFEVLSFETNVGDHDHFNYAFTQPGIYDVEFKVEGFHFGDLKEGIATFQFEVTAVPEPSSIGGAILMAGSFWVYRRHRKKALRLKADSNRTRSALDVGSTAS